MFIKWDQHKVFVLFRAYQEVVEESFLTTVQTLLNAPASSPLAEVDINNVVELLVELTRPSTLLKPSSNTEVSSYRADGKYKIPQQLKCTILLKCSLFVTVYTQEVCVHDYFAVRICGEMLKDPTAPEVRLYAKTLSNLELSRDETVRKDLQTLLQEIAQVHAGI